MQKTKPTQHSVRELRALGLTPHLLACRSAQVNLFLFKQPLQLQVGLAYQTLQILILYLLTTPWLLAKF